MGQDEAIRLAYALTAKAAELTGVRVLAIKGLVANAHGLRPQRTPADVDVLIEPEGFGAFTRQLEEWGWQARYGEYIDFPVPGPSVTYIHDRWPCDIDAHHHFLGFLRPPQQVFNALWARHELLPFAGRPAPIVDWAGSVAIMALHSVRSTPEDSRHAEELRHLVNISSEWTPVQRRDLRSLALATGCVQSLDGVWQWLGIPVDPAAEDISGDDLAEWRRSVDGRIPSTLVWLRYLWGGGPGGEMLSRARTMLWPSEAQLRATLPISGGNAALFRARLVRIAKALRKAPRNLLAVVWGGRSVTRDSLIPPPQPKPGTPSRERD